MCVLLLFIFLKGGKIMNVKTQMLKYGKMGIVFLSKQAPTIFSGMAVVGVGATAVLAARAGMKAEYVLADAYAEKNKQAFEVNRDNPNPVAQSEDLTTAEKVKALIPLYIPAAITGISTIALIVAANTINLRRQAALLGVATLAETTLKEYQNKMEELFGEKKAEQVRQEVVKSKAETALATLNDGDIFRAKGGNVLCCDAVSGRFFYSDINTIREAGNELNRRMCIGDEQQTLNDLYYELNIPPIHLGEELGWSVETPIDFHFDSAVRSDGTPYLIMDFKEMPFLGFRD